MGKCQLTVCVPSSRLINSLENVKPGMRPRFFNQKTAAKEPEKKMPSTQANATKRTLNGYSSVQSLRRGWVDSPDPEWYNEEPILLSFEWQELTLVKTWIRRDWRPTILHAVEEKVFLLSIPHVGLYEETIGLRVDLLHHRLKSVECSRFCDLNIHGELFDDVFLWSASLSAGQKGLPPTIPSEAAKNANIPDNSALALNPRWIAYEEWRIVHSLSTCHSSLSDHGLDPALLPSRN